MENLTFHEVYKKYRNLVLKVAYDYSGDYGAAEDISQDTFLKLYMYFDDMDKRNLKSFLYTVAKHAALNYRKKAGRELLGKETADDALAAGDPARSAEEEVLRTEREMEIISLHDRIFLGLMEKNPRWHEAVLLVYLMHVPQARVAEEMGISVNVLHSMLHRAKVWIRETYGVEYHEMNRD